MRQETAGGLYAWEFEKDGQALRVRVDGQLTFNNTYAMIDAALDGYGVAYVPENIVERQIASGLLVQVLDDWSLFFGGYFLYYPSRRQNLPALKGHYRSATPTGLKREELNPAVSYGGRALEANRLDIVVIVTGVARMGFEQA